MPQPAAWQRSYNQQIRLGRYAAWLTHDKITSLGAQFGYVGHNLKY